MKGQAPIDQVINSESAEAEQGNVGYAPVNTVVKTHTKKERQVGTVTMGICLIAVGVVIMLHLFFPQIYIVGVTKYAPFILVMLGVEILYSYFAHKDKQLKYDFLSTLFCGTIIIIALAISTISSLYEEYGSPRWQVINGVNQQLYDVFHDGLQGNKNIRDMEVTADIHSVGPEIESLAYTEMKDSDNIYMKIHLNAQDYENKEAFAKDCAEILSQAQGVNIQPGSIFFEWQNEEMMYTLKTTDKFSMNQAPEKLALMVDEVKLGYPEEEYDNKNYAASEYNDQDYDPLENETEEIYEEDTELSEEAVEAVEVE